MRDFLCKVYDKLYCFLGYADMRLILGYESGGKGCTRISFYIRGGLRPLFLWFFTLPGISFMTSVLQNIKSSILISKIHAKNPQTLILIHHYAISLDLRLSSPNPHAKRLSSFRTFLSSRCVPWTNVQCQNPVTEYNSSGERVYSEIHTADWWWDTKV